MIDTERSLLRDLVRDEVTTQGQTQNLRSNLLQEELDRRFSSFQTQLDQRFEQSRISLLERHTAQQTAVRDALTAAEKAVTKAEIANEKRFEGVNEFRKQLSDQTATFPTRTEVGTRFDALTGELSRTVEQTRQMELRLTSRLDRGDGAESGGKAAHDDQRLTVTQIIAAIAVLATIISVVLLAYKH